MYDVEQPARPGHPLRRILARAAVTVLMLFAGTGLAIGTTAAPAFADCAKPGQELLPIPPAQLALAPERAWPVTQGAGQRVAVLDTGVANLPELNGRIAASTVTGGGSTADCIGHGTGMADLIGSQQVAGATGHGVAPGSVILAAKVTGDQWDQGSTPGLASPKSLAAGINWAIGQQAAVIDCSLITYQDDTDLHNAVNNALAHNIVVIAPVGETGQNEPQTPYPAAYDGVIGVAGVDSDGSHWNQSRTGPFVDLSAPAEKITVAQSTGGLVASSGTSYAAAFVAGTAALVRAAWPSLSPAEVAQRLEATASPAPGGSEGANVPLPPTPSANPTALPTGGSTATPGVPGGLEYGFGIVNPYQAVVDRVAVGRQSRLPAMKPVVRVPDTAWIDSRTLALIVTACVVALVLGAVALAVIGPRGRRGRWRTGLARVPEPDPEDDEPRPPAELFSAEQQQVGRTT